MGFWNKLEASAKKRNSLLCVGLDPHPGRTPARYGSDLAFLKDVVQATQDVACCYKPNIAFYEAMGAEGWAILKELMDSIPDDIPVLLDAKRNDIGSKAAAYAAAVFDALGADAVTVTPYLGRDGLDPFLAYEDRGVFMLCKTSNPSGGEVQDWSQGGQPLYAHLAQLAPTWTENPLGLVIGATYPSALAAVRAQSESAWFLIPGVGAQGGDLGAALSAGLRQDGLGVLINSSRGILYADDPEVAAKELRDAINAERAKLGARPAQQDVRVLELALALHDAGCVRFGEFTLHSGAKSPVYVDLRRLVTYPSTLALVAGAYAGLMANLEYDRVAAIPYAALPIGTAVTLQTGDPLIYPRKETKAYGTKRQIEGEFHEGETALLLDDLISSGGSKVEAIKPLADAGLVVKDVVVLIDREQGGRADLEARGYRLHAVITLRQMVTALRHAGRLSADESQRVFDYLDGKG